MVIAILILVAGIYFFSFPLFVFTFWNEVPYDNGKYGTYLPKHVLNDEVRTRGLPDYLNRANGGEAEWIRNGIYRRIVLSDKPVPIEEPFKHLKILSYHLPVIKIPPRPDKALDHLYSLNDNELVVTSHCTSGCQALIKVLMEGLPSENYQPLTLEFQRGGGFDYEGTLKHHADVL